MKTLQLEAVYPMAFNAFDVAADQHTPAHGQICSLTGPAAGVHPNQG